MTEGYTLSCDVCNWMASTSDGTTHSSVSTAAITHYTETGHSPIQADSYTPDSTLMRPPLTWQFSSPK